MVRKLSRVIFCKGLWKLYEQSLKIEKIEIFSLQRGYFTYPKPFLREEDGIRGRGTGLQMSRICGTRASTVVQVQQKRE
jgi:hypothetical protein